MEVGAVFGELKGDLLAALAVQESNRKLEAKETYTDMVYLVSALVQNGKKFCREATTRMRAIVSEIYSAPRVTEMAKRKARLGMLPGFALDLIGCDEKGCPWDFNIAEMRDEAERRLDRQKPMLLIGTPMCTAFSNIQNLNKAKRDPAIVKAEFEKALLHLRWCCRFVPKADRQRGLLST